MTLLIAVSVIFIGVLLLLGNLGKLPAQLVGLWPVVLIIAGLVGICSFDGVPLKKNSKKK